MLLLNFFRSSIGLKIIMALTGLALFGFTVGHMAGNLQMFLAPEHINKYAAFLQGQKELLWMARIGLLVAVFLHIYAAVKLSALNAMARPVSYSDPAKSATRASVASRTMLLSGVVVMVFIVFHLLHFTGGFIQPDYFHYEDPAGRHDVYRMVFEGFKNPLISGFYIISVVLLGAHLSHGLMSMFRSLGLSSPAYRRQQELFANAFSALIVVGMAIVPFAVLIGLINPTY
ncbi:MAG: succinate dehydrogenase cytochrome b subunit [Candidatus Methylacidiphilales bacterium]|nr:succinate dehydrogenase cytochrome b subunit [Candidatus Methylacidiphilales bacterium]